MLPVSKSSLQAGLIPVLGFPGGIHDLSQHYPAEFSSLIEQIPKQVPWNGKTGLRCSSRCVLNYIHFVENRKIFLELVFPYSISASLNTSHSLPFQYLFSLSDTLATWIPKQTNKNPTRSDHVLSAPDTFDGSSYLQSSNSLI